MTKCVLCDFFYIFYLTLSSTLLFCMASVVAQAMAGNFSTVNQSLYEHFIPFVCKKHLFFEKKMVDVL